VPDQGLDEEEKESAQMLYDNSMSTLFKIILYQNDGGVLVKNELIPYFLNSLPLKTDVDEA